MSQGNFQANNPYASFGGVSVADAPVDERASFIRNTYTHLAMAVYGCAALCWAVFQTGLVEQFVPMLFANQFSWLIVLGVFMAGSWAANSLAHSNTSVGLQYAGLGLGILVWTFMLCPALFVAQHFTVELAGGTEINVIAAAGIVTLVMFGGLSAIAWTTKADLSFLSWGLGIAGFAAMGLILCSILFGFSLGIFFTVAMIVLACGYILYDTSNVIHHYQPGQHVAASLALFMSIAHLFWYVLRFVMAFSSND